MSVHGENIMKTNSLKTSFTSVRLIEPDVERDAQLGVEWLDGARGRETLQLMGVADKDNKSTTLEHERARVQSFIEREDQLNWMIELDGRVVGAVWVDLQQNGNLPAPGVHIMIGDPAARGRGVGSAAFSIVTKYLQEIGYTQVFTRHLVGNSTAQSLAAKNGFVDIGEAYTDEDGLIWQNMEVCF